MIPVITTRALSKVDFDPQNPEHRKAYLMLQYGEKQHPTLRFNLRHPFTSVFTQMQVDMAEAFCAQEIADCGIQTAYDYSKFAGIGAALAFA